jgi:hypothetical protein
MYEYFYYGGEKFIPEGKEFKLTFSKFEGESYDIFQESSVEEKKGKDHDGDGDIDSDDYMAAKDKAIKKAMGKKVDENQGDYVSFAMQNIGDESTPVRLTHGFNRYDEKKYKTTLGKALAFIGKKADHSAIENGDVTVDGGPGLARITIGDQEFDIKAMGKDEQLKEAIKGIIRKTLLSEAATNRLSDVGDKYGDYKGMQVVVNDLENIVTDVESFFAKTRERIQSAFDKIGNVETPDGMKVGAFLAPGIADALFKDLVPVRRLTKKDINLPQTKFIQAGTYTEQEIEQEPKQTVFSPVNEKK